MAARLHGTVTALASIAVLAIGCGGSVEIVGSGAGADAGDDAPETGSWVCGSTQCSG